jgi:hypothetical protein
VREGKRVRERATKEEEESVFQGRSERVNAVAGCSVAAIVEWQLS